MPPPTVVIPPWISSIDPTAPVDRMLAGYRTGLSAGEAQSAAAARAQQMMLAQQQAAELNAYRQQQQALDAVQFNATLRLQQDKAQREAATAAAQLEGQRGIQEDLAAGLEWPQALAKWAPKLFAGEPRGLAQAMEQAAGPRPPVFGTTPEGIPYSQDARTGALRYAPASALRGNFEPEIIDVGEGVKAVRTGPQRIQIIDRPPVEGALSQLDRSKLGDITAQERSLRSRLLREPAEAEAITINESLGELKRKRDEIYTKAIKAKAANEKVFVRTSNGKQGWLPASNLAAAKARDKGLIVLPSPPTEPSDTGTDDDAEDEEEE